MVFGEGARTGEPGDAPADRDNPPSLDTSVAHQARIYDYWLGGKDNYAADREAAEAAIAAYPGVASGARANRQFLARAVRHLASEAGIRQFLDIGTGIPAANNTHEVAQSEAPECRVVYVDYDRCKSSCAHAREARTTCRERVRARGTAETWRRPEASARSARRHLSVSASDRESPSIPGPIGHGTGMTI